MGTGEKRYFEADWQETCSVEKLSPKEMQWRHMLRYWMYELSRLEAQLAEYKASDASKEQYIAEIYSRAREAERELALHKKALELAASDIFCPDILCDENSSKYGVCEVDCKSNYYLAQAKEALADGPNRS